jgi:hypothetical protein
MRDRLVEGTKRVLQRVISKLEKSTEKLKCAIEGVRRQVKRVQVKRAVLRVILSEEILVMLFSALICGVIKFAEHARGLVRALLHLEGPVPPVLTPEQWIVVFVISMLVLLVMGRSWRERLEDTRLLSELMSDSGGWLFLDQLGVTFCIALQLVSVLLEILKSAQ